MMMKMIMMMTTTTTTTTFHDLLLCLISELEGSGASAAVRLINCTLFLPTVENYVSELGWPEFALCAYQRRNSFDWFKSSNLSELIHMQRHCDVRIFSPRFKEGR